MKKGLLTIGIYCLAMVSAKSQTTVSNLKAANIKKEDKTGFRTLKIEEVNLVSAYYHQNGNNSAVTGGVGTEKLWDVANSLDLKMSFLDKQKRVNSLVLDASMDYYSSASSDKIDSRSLSSASILLICIIIFSN